MGRIAVEMGAVDGVGEVTARAAVAAELVDEEAGVVAVATEGAGPMADCSIKVEPCHCKAPAVQ